MRARGHAGLQVLYHPDRITNPIKRSGPRGSGPFREISWDDALNGSGLARLATIESSKSASSLAFLSRPLSGQRHAVVEGFPEKAYGAPPGSLV